MADGEIAGRVKAVKYYENNLMLTESSEVGIQQDDGMSVAGGLVNLCIQLTKASLDVFDSGKGVCGVSKVMSLFRGK